MKTRYMLVDVSNILHRTFFVHAKRDIQEIIGLAWNTTFTTLNKYFKDIKPDQLIFAFDHPSSNWRKKHTQSEECVSGRLYKGNRHLNMTPTERERYETFQGFIQDFEGLMREHTSIVCLTEPSLEADDLIAGFVQQYGDENKIFIISADKDLHQLLTSENIVVVNPDKKCEMYHTEIDVDYSMFIKCFRGDPGDNVQNAFPGVREDRLKKAYDDDYELLNIMQTVWHVKDADGNIVKSFKVHKLYKENELLINLTMQPENIRKLMSHSIKREMMFHGQFSHFDFLRFLGKYNLKNVASRLEYYIPMLSKTAPTSLLVEEQTS